MGVVLHEFPQSPFCEKVRRGLRHKKIEYSSKTYGFREYVSGAVRKANPAGLLPVLELDSGEMLPESSAILARLDELQAEPPLLPKDPAERGLACLVEDWAATSLQPVLSTLSLRAPEAVDEVLESFGLPAFLPRRMLAKRFVRQSLRGLAAQGAARKPDAMLLAEVGEAMATLEGLLGGREWLVGDAPSVADLAVIVLVRGRIGKNLEPVAKAPAKVRKWMDRAEQLGAA